MRALLYLLLVAVVCVNAACVDNSGCTGHGICRDAQCVCFQGWSGATCTTATCANVTTGVDCSDQGTCSSGVCTCVYGYAGPTCSSFLSSCAATSRDRIATRTCSALIPRFVNMSYHGIIPVDCASPNCACKPSININTTTCALSPIYQINICPGDTTGVTCSNQGQCVNGVCQCSTGYSGISCQTAGAGVCPVGRTGSTCSLPTCDNPALGVCSGRGTCDSLRVYDAPTYGRGDLPYIVFNLQGGVPVYIASGTDGRYLAATAGGQVNMATSRTGTGTLWVAYRVATGVTTDYTTVLYNPLAAKFIGSYVLNGPLAMVGTADEGTWWRWDEFTLSGGGTTPGTVLHAIQGGATLEHPLPYTSGPPSSTKVINAAGLYYGVSGSGSSASLYTMQPGTNDPNNINRETVWTIATGGGLTLVYNGLSSLYLAVRYTCVCTAGQFGTTCTLAAALRLSVTTVGTAGRAPVCNTNGQLYDTTYMISPIYKASSTEYVWLMSSVFDPAPVTAYGTTPDPVPLIFPDPGVPFANLYLGVSFPSTDALWRIQRLVCACAAGYTGDLCERAPVGTAICPADGTDAVVSDYVATSSYGTNVCASGGCTSNSTNGYCACTTYWTGSTYACQSGTVQTVCGRPGCTACPGGRSLLYLNGQVVIGADAPNYDKLGCCPTAYSNSDRTSRPVCGGRGTCARDGICDCFGGLGGTYCCALGVDGTPCGPHGTCTDTGLCTCANGWGGQQCNINQRCGTCQNGGTCVTADPIAKYLTIMGLPTSAPGVTLDFIYLFVTLPAKIRTITNVTGPASASFGPYIYLLQVFLGYDASNINNLAPYWVNSAHSLALESDLYSASLFLWSLPLFQSMWVTATGSDRVARINAAFGVIYPLTQPSDTCVASPTYCNTIKTQLTAAASANDRDLFIRPLMAMLVHSYLRDPVTQSGGIYPAGVESQCICPTGFNGSQCELACPTAGGRICNTYALFQQRGMCYASSTAGVGVCACALGRAGAACEITVIGVCMPAGASQICSGRAQCVNTGGTTYACACPSGWTGAYCQTSICSQTTTECSNAGTCGADGKCTCNVNGALAVPSNTFLPVGPLCQFNGWTACATVGSDSTYRQCSSALGATNRGICVYNNTASCSCMSGYYGVHCELSICGAGCNVNQTCNTDTAACACLPRYSGSNCAQHTCAFGVPDPTGISCICQSGYRVDGAGACTILVCPFVAVLDTGSFACVAGMSMCNTTAPDYITDPYTYAHVHQCCYDQCRKTNGDTNCQFNSTGSRECACSPALAYTQVGGVCQSKCNGQTTTIIGGSVTCTCSPTWPLYPPISPIPPITPTNRPTEYQTEARCERVTCLNGGLVKTSGSSCDCSFSAGFTGPTCAIAAGTLPSSSASIPVLPSSSASTLPSSSSTDGFSSTIASTGGGVTISSSATVRPSSSGANLPSSSSSSSSVPLLSSSSSASNQLPLSSSSSATTVIPVDGSSSSSSSTLSGGAIAGIAVGATAAALGLGGLGYFAYIRNAEPSFEPISL